MTILTIKNGCLSFGGPLLLENIELTIEAGERICLIGRNGTGKSTLLKIINGEIKLDDGEISYQDGLVIASLSQEVPRDIQGSVFDVVAASLGKAGEYLRDYHQISLQLAQDYSDALLKKLEHTQQALEGAGGWDIKQRVDTVLTRMQLPDDAEFSALSGGRKRRGLAARPPGPQHPPGWAG